LHPRQVTSRQMAAIALMSDKRQEAKYKLGLTHVDFSPAKG